MVERRPDVTSPVFGGIGLRGTPIEQVRQARGGGSGDDECGTFQVGGGKCRSVDGTHWSSPSWTFDPLRLGAAIIYCDIKGDDLPDFVAGNSGDTSIPVFHNTGDPTILVDGFETEDTGR